MQNTKSRIVVAFVGQLATQLVCQLTRTGLSSYKPAWWPTAPHQESVAKWHNPVKSIDTFYNLQQQWTFPFSVHLQRIFSPMYLCSEAKSLSLNSCTFGDLCQPNAAGTPKAQPKKLDAKIETKTKSPSFFLSKPSSFSEEAINLCYTKERGQGKKIRTALTCQV